MLSQKKQSINTIADNFTISRPAVSKHIKVLHQAGFITVTEQGRERYCELSQRGFDDVRAWIDYFEEYWKTRLRSLEDFLKNNAASINPAP